MERKVIAIAGMSCAYKSSVVRELERRGAGRRLRLDRYYLGDEHVPVRAGLKDFEDPRGLDLALAAAHVRVLCSGERVRVPVYDKDAHARVGSDEMRLAEGERLIVDGLHALHDPIRPCADVRISLHIGEETVWKRRRRRNKGVEYTDAYHRGVMCHWIPAFRAVWLAASELALEAEEDDPQASRRLADRIEAYLTTRLPRP